MTNWNTLLVSRSGQGGYRENAGRKSSWQHTETQTIRVPKVFANQLIELARRLDKGEALAPETQSKSSLIDSVTDSKILSLDTVTDSKVLSLDIVTDSTLSLSEALVQAQAILKRKRSAKESIVQLLSAIYHAQLRVNDLA